MASRYALPLLLIAALAGLCAFGYSTLSAASAPERASAAVVRQRKPQPQPQPHPQAQPQPQPRKGIHRIAIVHGSVPLRKRPSGRVVARVEARTEFGSPRSMSVAIERGAWLGVVTQALPNGKLAWVNRRNHGLRMRRTAYSLHADLSARWLELRRAGRRIRRIAVAVGRPGSDTPTGRFAVTDKLDGTSFGAYYGCCVLALNGHQPNLPAGWSGGNRLAIHGTDAPSSIGTAASAGCLRAADADLRILMRRVPLGTPVFIRN